VFCVDVCAVAWRKHWIKCAVCSVGCWHSFIFAVMLRADQFNTLTDPIVNLFSDYETSVLTDIARRLGNLDFASAAWQMQRLTESGSLYKDVLKQLAKTTGQSETTLAEIFKNAGVKTIKFDDKIYKEAGLNPLPLNLSPAMLKALQAGLTKTQGILSNLTMSTATAAQDSFIKAADLAYMQVSTGAMSYDEAIRSAIKNMAGGLDVVDYASGHTDKLDVAMRRTVLTGVAQTANQLQIERAGYWHNSILSRLLAKHINEQRRVSFQTAVSGNVGFYRADHAHDSPARCFAPLIISFPSACFIRSNQ